MFTTDGEQITLEFIQKLFEHSRVFESITKDVMNRLQTNRIEGYTTTLHYAYRNKVYDFEEVKGCIIDELGSYGKIVSKHTVKDEIKKFCYERKEKFTNEIVLKVFMTCIEILTKC